MSSDKIERIGTSIVQHGHLNERVYVIRLSRDDIPSIIPLLDELAEKEKYSKIFVKVPESSKAAFIDACYRVEATVPFYFYGKETAAFMAKYSDPRRSVVVDAQHLEEIVSRAFRDRGKEYHPQVPAGYSLVHPHQGDEEEIAALFRSVFETYPFPLFDPDFIRESMEGGFRYFCIRYSKRIVAVASCEVDADTGNAEMTDFITDPRFQGKGLAGTLLHAMEAGMKEEGINLVYTIARAKSYPINRTFARAGYEYGGMLPNNTHICGTIESMNVWFKHL